MQQRKWVKFRLCLCQWETGNLRVVRTSFCVYYIRWNQHVGIQTESSICATLTFPYLLFYNIIILRVLFLQSSSSSQVNTKHSVLFIFPLKSRGQEKYWKEAALLCSYLGKYTYCHTVIIQSLIYSFLASDGHLCHHECSL